MTEMNRPSRSAGQLTFHIPYRLRVREEETLKALNIAVAALDPIEEVIPLAKLPSITEPLCIENDIVPFHELKLTNSPIVYQIGTTFLKDISKGHKNFGFASLSKDKDDLHLLVYASFINYSLKKPVLIVVRDINDKAFDIYRKNFTQGTLWKWETSDWGNLCFIDYKQTSKYSEEFNHLDLNFITDQFTAILWALPDSNKQEMNKASLPILSKINSVTFVIRSGETKNKDLEKSKAYYQCFGIPLKGILVGKG